MIIGRKKELKQLNKAFSSKESEFIVVYGRRRVGKTYLIREFFVQQKCIFLHVTGKYQKDYKEQIKAFTEELSKTFFDNVRLELPTSWDEAFKLLNQQISKYSAQKIVIFLDELPWLATRRSDLLPIIEHAWNHNWSQLSNVILVACGSSASWIMKNIIYNPGGLHNRVTCEIPLGPFNLAETKDFLEYRDIMLNHRHILSLYMALGGIPYYLKYIEPGLTAEQNIQNIIFMNAAPLKGEFDKLFSSLFKNSEAYIEIIRLLSSNKSGLSRSEINKLVTLSVNGGRLSERLNDLSNAGFIHKHIPWQKTHGEYYKLIDEFCLFYLHWVVSQSNTFIKDHWLRQTISPSYKAWSGYAFESVCMKHVEQMISALDIKASGIVDSWRYVPRKKIENGAQIDFLIDRDDDAITLCEIKYTNTPFNIDKQYALNLENKINVFQNVTKTTKQIFLALVSASGIKNSVYAKKLVTNVVTLEDLFK